MLYFDNMSMIKMETGEIKAQVQFAKGSGKDRKVFPYNLPEEVANAFYDNIKEHLYTVIKSGAVKMAQEFLEHIEDLGAEVGEFVIEEEPAQEESENEDIKEVS